ncbi:glutamate receptor 1-like [Littorina saxatilis]|uniref:glutamate receptor 1-like n=1 Tax=Littorina saxatilis TaxID=31220 RepID=UPI0038B4B9E2
MTDFAMNQYVDNVHVPDYGTMVVPVVTALQWTEVVIVTDQPWFEGMTCLNHPKTRGGLGHRLILTQDYTDTSSERSCQIECFCVCEQEVDLGLAATDFRHDRSLMMDYPAIIHFTPIVMAYRKPPANNNSLWLILTPLSKWLLVAIVCAAVGTALLLFLVTLTDVTRVKPEMTSLEKPEMTSLMKPEMTSLIKPATTSLEKPNTRHGKRLMQLAAAFEVIFSALLFKPTEKKFPSHPARVLLCSWWLLSLVVVAAFSGTLTAYLSVARQPQLFSSLQDLVTKQHDYTWGTSSESSIMLVFKESNDTINQKVWAGLQRFQGEGHNVLTPDPMQLVRRVATTDEKLVVITPETMVTSLRGDCDVEVVEVKLNSGRSGPVLPKGSALVRPLSDLILRLHASGLVSGWTDKWFPRTPCPLRAPPGPNVISLVHVQGVVLALPLGVGLALLALTLERGYFRRRGTDSSPPISPPIASLPPISPHPISSPSVLPPSVSPPP